MPYRPWLDMDPAVSLLFVILSLTGFLPSVDLRLFDDYNRHRQKAKALKADGNSSLFV